MLPNPELLRDIRRLAAERDRLERQRRRTLVGIRAALVMLSERPELH